MRKHSYEKLNQFSLLSIISGITMTTLISYTLYAANQETPDNHNYRAYTSAGIKLGIVAASHILFPIIAAYMHNKAKDKNYTWMKAYPTLEDQNAATTDSEELAQVADTTAATATTTTPMLQPKKTPISVLPATAACFFVLISVTDCLPEILGDTASDATKTTLNALFDNFILFHLVRLGLSGGIGGLITDGINKCRGFDQNYTVAKFSLLIMINALIGPILIAPAVNSVAPELLPNLAQAIGGEQAMAKFNLFLSIGVPCLFGAFKALPVSRMLCTRRYLLPDEKLLPKAHMKRGLMFAVTAIVFMIGGNLGNFIKDKDTSNIVKMLFTEQPLAVIGLAAATLGITHYIVNKCIGDDDALPTRRPGNS